MWGDKRYNNLNYFLKNKFGEKIYKLSLDAGFTCPNRDGRISKDGCLFCSKRGSGDFTYKDKSVKEQIKMQKELLNNKISNGKYIAYFQAYTNTYDTIENLKKIYNSALSEPDIVGIAIATRPDCLNDEIINLLSELSKKTYLWVELGLQTINENTAKLINRGYNLDVFESAIQKLEDANIDKVIHVITGLPNETSFDVIKTIKYLNNLSIQGIKIHMLHILKETPLERFYFKEKFDIMEKDNYINLVIDIIKILRKDIVIHRLTGDAPRNLLIAPLWSTDKKHILNKINKKLKDQNILQGEDYNV
ncbi:MAG: TIGR01212 family radical SAM protein [Clostridia bacterium]|jgi:radical SAM protein (TIGR01212 family)|nr:TIGR01212 family radical SAM protein [Clostridia bacterium]